VCGIGAGIGALLPIPNRTGGIGRYRVPDASIGLTLNGTGHNETLNNNMIT